MNSPPYSKRLQKFHGVQQEELRGLPLRLLVSGNDWRRRDNVMEPQVGKNRIIAEFRASPRGLRWPPPSRAWAGAVLGCFADKSLRANSGQDCWTRQSSGFTGAEYIKPRVVFCSAQRSCNSEHPSWFKGRGRIRKQAAGRSLFVGHRNLSRSWTRHTVIG